MRSSFDGRSVRTVCVAVVMSGLLLWVPLFRANQRERGKDDARLGSIHGSVYAKVEKERDYSEPHLVFLNDLQVALTSEGRQVASARTDAQGRFIFTGLAPGKYRLDWQVPNWVP